MAATQTSVASSASSVQLLAATAGRKAFSVFNDSTAVLYLLCDSAASAASTSAYTVQVAAGGYFECPYDWRYQDKVYGIWSAANGNARITEVS